MRSAGLLCAVAVLSAVACPQKGAIVVDAGVKSQPAPGEPVVTKRPPFPNMATAAWGQRVLEERVAAVHAEAAAATTAAVLDALHDMSPGSEKRAAELAASAYKNAKSD